MVVLKIFSRNNFGRVPVSVKRLIQTFNKKVPSYIGCKSYMGPNSFFFFEKFLMDELTKLNIYSNNSFTSWKTPYPSDSSKTMFSHRSSKRPIKKYFLPKINTGVNSMSMSDREYLEVRIKVKFFLPEFFRNFETEKEMQKHFLKNIMIML